MKNLLFLLSFCVLFSCSKSNDSDDVIPDDGFSVYKIVFSKSGDTSLWYDELNFKTSLDGWKIDSRTTISDGFLTGTNVLNSFTISSLSKMNKLDITYFTTPYFDGTNFLDASNPTTLNVVIKVYEDDVLIDTQTLNLDGTVRATKDFSYSYISK
tara:strand:- start:41 stop:505 length:465 start_codon:yes stop_codon:yes gene_type:complete